MSCTEWEVRAVLGGGFLVLRNGYQWGPDSAQFDHMIGCSTQTFPSYDAAQEAITLGIEYARASTAKAANAGQL